MESLPKKIANTKVAEDHFGLSMGLDDPSKIASMLVAQLGNSSRSRQGWIQFLLGAKAAIRTLCHHFGTEISEMHF